VTPAVELLRRLGIEHRVVALNDDLVIFGQVNE